jgi:hypothetical protein
MATKRIFTEQELEEMSGLTREKALAAIESGDKEKAKQLVVRAYEEFNRHHEGYMIWITGLLTYIYNNCGIEGLEKAERFAHGIEDHLVLVRRPPANDLRSRIEHLAKGLRGHLQQLTIDEDDEKIVLSMHPCGSGEKIIKMGAYEAGLAKIKEPRPITWGMKDFPIYCVHCPLGELSSFERGGDFEDFFSFRFVSDPIGKENCQFVIYKNRADIPESIYKRISKKKPAAPVEK